MVHSTRTKIIIQCDFDNTIAEYDVSFFLLDTFAEGNWRYYLEQYMAGKITVGAFNEKSFGMVKADKQAMLDCILVKNKVRIRAGFKELLAYCSEEGIRFVIVSNGLDFYIEAILKDIGVGDIEVHAAQTQFSTDGLKVRYVGPDGGHLDSGFKDVYARLFQSQGYSVVYVGDGSSDMVPASQADYIFARDNLLARCNEKKLGCVPFNDFNDVIKGVELLP